MTLFDRSLEGLRCTVDSRFTVAELYKFYREPEVIARCKVQAQADHFLAILVIAGEVARTAPCTSAADVRAIAQTWKADLLSQGWRSQEHLPSPPSPLWR